MTSCIVYARYSNTAAFTPLKNNPICALNKMATFERCTDGQSSSDTVQYRKYQFIRLEPTIKKFLTVIQIDLSRLHRHRLNVEKFNRLQDWTSLHTEQINATRTVQQIKANVHEIEKSRLQICDEELDKFDDKINDVKHSAIKSVCEFVELSHGDVSNSDSDSSPGGEHQSLTFGGQDRSQNDLFQGQTQLNELPENTQVAESWERLQENLEDLNVMIHQFATVVDNQQGSIDRIEDNIGQAHITVTEGAKFLGKATKYKAAVLPITGAVIGTALAGPIGLFAGAKIGALIGAACGTMGFLSGKYIKKRQQTATDIELSKLSRSNSLPDVHVGAADGNSWFGWGRKRNQSIAELPDSSS